VRWRLLSLTAVIALTIDIPLASQQTASTPQSGDGTVWLPSGPEQLPVPLVRAIRRSPYAFFRLANRAWASRVCAEFASDLPSMGHVQLHGDAHVEQYAVTETGYGLDDFDDTSEGSPVIDLVRFIGSLRLAAYERGWIGQFDRLADAFLRGYQEGLSEAGTPPVAWLAVPRLVQRLRKRPVRDQAAFLAWADGLMRPVEPRTADATRRAFDLLAAHMATGEPQRPAGYFRVKRIGGIELGIGSRGLPKLLVRVEGRTAAANDDVILEAKQPANLIGIECLAPAEQSAAVRVIAGTKQIGRLRHDVLSLVPSLVEDRASAHHWWIHDWTPSYVEVSINDPRSVAELSELAEDAGTQLGTASLPVGGEAARERRRQETRAIAALNARLRRVSIQLANDLLRAWDVFRHQGSVNSEAKP